MKILAVEKCTELQEEVHRYCLLREYLFFQSEVITDWNNSNIICAKKDSLVLVDAYQVGTTLPTIVSKQLPPTHF
jgi:hypothetical protein